jgi:hypothetical protein
MTRGLILKCVQCASQEFHLLYEMGSPPGSVPHPRSSGSYECVHCGHVADAAAQEAMVATIQQAREADARGAKDDPEPSGREQQHRGSEAVIPGIRSTLNHPASGPHHVNGAPVGGSPREVHTPVGVIRAQRAS